MKFNKNSKIVKVSAYAEGYYSGATAYGELYIPYEFYEENKEKLSYLTVYVSELDGKHSEVECDIEYEEITVLDILEMTNAPYDQDRDIDEKLFYRFCDTLCLSDEESDINNDFSNGILSLEKVFTTEEIKFNLSKDTVIDDVLVPKGTLIHFRKDTGNKISDNWTWEFNFNIRNFYQII